jgi:hypothetical protein
VQGGDELTGAPRVRSGSSCARRATCRRVRPARRRSPRRGNQAPTRSRPVRAADPLPLHLEIHHAAAASAAAAAGGGAHRIRRPGRRSPAAGGEGTTGTGGSRGGLCFFVSPFFYLLLFISLAFVIFFAARSFVAVDTPVSLRWPWPVHLYVHLAPGRCVFLFGSGLSSTCSCS